MNNSTNIEVKLNEREKRVLISLVQFPGVSDVEIASRVGIKHSTFSTIKKRLKKRGCISTIYIPNFAVFGAEIIGINIHRLPSFSMIQQQDLDIGNLDKYLGNKQNLFLSVIENELALYLRCYRDFEQLDNASWQFEKKLKESGINLGFQYELNFPIHHSDFPRFFDYSRSITKHLKLPFMESSPKNVFLDHDVKHLKITETGKEVLQCFIDSPNRTPKIVSQLIEKPRTTTTRWLRRLVDANLLTPRVIPNTDVLGYQVGLIVHFSITSSQETIFQKTLMMIDSTLTPIILMRSGFDIVAFSMFRSFESTQIAETEFFSSMTKAGISFITEYHYLLFLPHTQRTLTFNDVIQSIFSQDEDFQTSY